MNSTADPRPLGTCTSLVDAEAPQSAVRSESSGLRGTNRRSQGYDAVPGGEQTASARRESISAAVCAVAREAAMPLATSSRKWDHAANPGESSAGKVMKRTVEPDIVGTDTSSTRVTAQSVCDEWSLWRTGKRCRHVRSTRASQRVNNMWRDA